MEIIDHKSNRIALWTSIFLIIISVTETAFKTEKIFYPIGIVLLGICIAKKKFVIRKDYSLAILLYVGYVVITCMWSPAASALRDSFVKVTVIIFLFMQLQVKYSKQDVKLIKKAFIIQLCALLGMVVMFGYMDWDGRLWIVHGSESTDPNSLCSWLIIPTVVLMEYIFSKNVKFIKKIVYIILLICAIAICLMTGSRSGIISVAVAIGLCLIYIFSENIKRNPKFALFIIIVGVIMIALVIKYMPKSVIMRFSYGNTSDFGGRTERWIDLLTTLFAHPLGVIFGMGEISTVFYSAYSVVAHNLFIEILFCQGLIGLFLVLWFVKGLIKNCVNEDKYRLVALISVLLMSLTLSEFTSRGVMLSFFLAGMKIKKGIND